MNVEKIAFGLYSCGLFATTAVTIKISETDWSIDISCMMIAACGAALTQYKLLVDKKITTWLAIPFEILMSAAGGFGVHALLRVHITDLRTLWFMCFALGVGGAPLVRKFMKKHLPEIYGDAK